MNKEYKIHAAYIFTFLIGIIIFLISYKFYDIPKLAELVTFGLTITSLVLAILAIAYAVYSNSSFTQNITTLNNASQEISTTAKDVSDAAKELKGKIEAIPTKLDRMESRFDEIMLLAQSPEPQETRQPTEKENDAASEIVELFVERTSIGVWIGAYVFFLAYKNKKLFVMEDVFSPIPSSGGVFYFNGVLSTMKTVGLLNFTYNDEVFTISSFNEKLSNVLDKRFSKIINEKFDEKFSDEPKESKVEFLDEIRLIEKYFEK